ncbi:hypothetical protein ACFVP0_09290 [Streptomyces cinereoruber]
MALTSCSGGSEPGGEDQVGVAETGVRSAQAYATCMDGQGVKVVDGAARTDGVDATTLGKAYRACRPSAPEDVQVPFTQWELALLTDFVTCMREKGHKGYGDPDPRTGNYTMPKDGEIDKEDELACLAAAEQKAGR